MRTNLRGRWWGTLAALAWGAGTMVPLSAENWPAWRGSEASGFAEGRAPVREFSDEKNLLWKAPLPGRGCSTPIVWDGRIIVTCAVGEKDGVLSFDGKGREQWRKTFGRESGPRHRSAGSGSNPSPVTDGKRIYVYYKSGTLAALSMDGEVQWQRNLQEDLGENTLKWDLGTSPVLAGGHLVIAVMQTNGKSFLLALDPESGKEVWKTKRDLGAAAESGDGYSTPLVRKVDGVETIVTWGADYLTGHEAKTGTPLWVCGGFNDEREPKLRTIASPVETAGVVLVPASRGHFVAGVPLDARKIAWKFPSGPDSATPLACKDRFLVLTDRGPKRGTIHCLAAKDGELLWEHTFPRAASIYYSSPLLVGDTLYCAREDGAVFCGTVGAKGLEKVTENRLDDTLVASPVVVDGKLLLRGHENLYCFGVK